MLDYSIRRIILLLPTLIFGSMVLFFSMKVLPVQDAADLQLQSLDLQTEEGEEAARILRRELGMDVPLWRAYTRWASGFITGDWGKSLHTKQSITDELKNRVPVSFELSIIGLFFTWAISFPLGVLAAVFQDGKPDYILRTGAYAIDAIPSFVVALLLITYLSVYANWAPPPMFSYIWDDPVRHMRIMILPSVVIGVGASGNLIRFTRTFLLEVLRQDYIRTARSKGLPERTVMSRHALRNLAIPFVTIIGGTIPGLLSSSVVIETIFSLPGMGRYLVGAAGNLDYPVVMTVTMFFAIITLGSQLVTDLAYAWVDPRVSYARGR